MPVFPPRLTTATAAAEKARAEMSAANHTNQSSDPPPTLLDVFGVLAPPAGAHGVGAGVFGFLTPRDARALRLVSRLCCADVAAARWLDAGTPITGSLAAWRACFPGARAANVGGRADLTDADFAHLAGVRTLNMEGCTGITNAGLAHLGGIHTLNIEGCFGITNAGLAHLRGIHTLNMDALARHPHAENERTSFVEEKHIFLFIS